MWQLEDKSLEKAFLMEGVGVVSVIKVVCIFIQDLKVHAFLSFLTFSRKDVTLENLDGLPVPSL